MLIIFFKLGLLKAISMSRIWLVNVYAVKVLQDHIQITKQQYRVPVKIQN